MPHSCRSTSLGELHASEPVESVDTLLTQLYQGLGVILHRENARATVKRMRAYTHHSDAILNAAATLQSSAAAAEDSIAL